MNKFRHRLPAALAASTLSVTLTTALLAAAPAHASGAPACTDTSSKGKVISPCMMIARANNWIANGVPYNQGGWYASPSGDGTYREDCAGFVAMAWHMTWSPPVTYDPPGLDDPSISKYLGTVGSLQSAGQLGTLQPGDALALTGEHIVLFAGWADSNHTAAYIDSESQPGNPTSQGYWYTSYLVSQGYKAYRYNNDQLNNPTSPPTTTVDSATVTSSAVTLTGTATPAADYFYFHIQQNGVDKLYSPAVPGTPGTPHHTWQFDPKSLPNGTYQVIAAASLNGQIGTSAPYTITINNGPVAPVAPTVSAPSRPLSGTVALTATAPGASSVTYSVDGTVIGTSTSGPDFSFEWSTVQTVPGPHTITATASNSGGSSPASAGVQVVVISRTSESAVVTGANTIAIYNVGTDGNVYGNSQSSPGGAFSGWQQLSTTGNFVGKPSAIVLNDGTIAVYARTTAGTVQGTNQNTVGGPFQPWITVADAGDPTGVAGDPAVVLTPSGTIAIYVTTTLGNIAGSSQSAPHGPFSAWGALPTGGTFVGKPAAIVTSDGTIAVYARTTAGTVQGTNQNTVGGPFQPWITVADAGDPTGVASDPAVVLTPNQTIAVYVTSASGTIAGSSQSTKGGPFSAWGALATGNGFVGKPSAIVTSDGIIAVYARTTAGTVQGTNQNVVNGPFQPYVTIADSGDPTGVADDPTTVTPMAGVIGLYVKNTSQNISGSTIANGTSTAWGQI